jgi:hypothetical protein
MKILRSVNSRGNSIESAGYFTVLKTNRWFPASSLSETFDYLRPHAKVAPSTPALGPAALHRANAQQALKFSQLVNLGEQDHRLLRPALIVLAALAITWSLLLWIMHP